MKILRWLKTKAGRLWFVQRATGRKLLPYQRELLNTDKLLKVTFDRKAPR